jgi:molybdopterin/thiamine biosynthesis adenylyltransferase
VPGEDRYCRQTRFQPIGPAGQQRLARASVAIVGVGALGSFSAGALARAGVGRIRILDRDTVEWSNLQRQWLFEEEDAREQRPKATAAAGKLLRINSGIDVQGLNADLNAANIEDLLEGVDVVVDATDNFETRFLINDYCVERGLPWVYGAAVGSYGLAFPVLPMKGPCLRCLYPAPPEGAQPTCETAGVLNTITSLVAAWQSAMVQRLLIEGSAALPGRLTMFEAWEMTTRQIAIQRDEKCPCCGARQFDFLDGRVRAPISLCGRNAVQIHERQGQLDLARLEQDLAGLGDLRRNDFALRFSPNGEIEMTIFPDGRAIIKGTQDVGVARSLYSRYLGR